MKALIFLILAPISLSGQVLETEPNGDQQIVLTVPEAARVDYWGRKGIESVPLISNLDISLDLAKQEANFQGQINENLRNAQVEYRNMLTSAANSNQAYMKQILDLTAERDKFKERARRRGNLIAAGTAALGGIAAFLILNK